MVGNQSMGMTNPILSAQQARQAMRGPQSTIQSMSPLNAQASAAMRQQLPRFAQAQMPAARLQEIDKIKYEEARKDLARRQLGDMYADRRQHNNALEVAQREYDNNLNLEDYKLKIDMDKKRMMYTLADEKYANVRGYVNTIFDDFDKWISPSGPGSMNQFMEDRRNQLLIDKASMAGITPEEVQAAYEAANPNMVGQAKLRPGSDLYNQQLVRILLTSPEKDQILGTISTQVQQEAAQMTQNKTIAYKTASDKVMKLGFTTAGATPLAPRTAPSQTDRPKINIDQLPSTVDLKEKGGGEPPEEKPPYIIANLVGKGADALKAVADYIAEDPARAAKLGIAAGGSAYILEQLTKMSPSKLSKIQEEINADLKAQSSVSDTKKTIDGKPKKLPEQVAKNKARRIAPDVMKSHAKKLLSEKEFSKLDFDKMKVDDFAKVIQKAKGGLITKMKNLGIKMIPTKDGKISIDKLKENRFLKGGLYFTLLGGVIDTITWSNLPDSKEKKEVEDTIDALSDANQSLIDAKNAEIAELKAQLGQASQASPLDASSAPTVRGIDGLDEVNASGMQILTDKMNADPKFAPIPSVIRP